MEDKVNDPKTVSLQDADMELIGYYDMETAIAKAAAEARIAALAHAKNATIMAAFRREGKPIPTTGVQMDGRVVTVVTPPVAS
jgi:hypothetical protein